MTILDTLIIDRTSADLSFYNYLKEKIQLRTATAEEWDLWQELESKAAYNASDLNRIAKAIEYVSGLLADYGCTVKGHPKSDWSQNDIPDSSDMSEFEKAIAKIRDCVPLTDSIEPAPKSLSELTIDQANSLEQMFLETENTLEKISSAYEYCGTVFTNEVDL